MTERKLYGNLQFYMNEMLIERGNTFFLLLMDNGDGAFLFHSIVIILRSTVFE